MSGGLPNLSIGDFAESLISGGQTQSAPPQGSQSFSTSPTFGAMPPPPRGQIDISNVQVPDDFVTSIVEGKEPEIAEEPVQRVYSEESSSGRLEDLLVKLCSLLEETKGLISEMGVTAGGAGNTVGSVGGVNFAGPAPVKKVRRRKKKKKSSVKETIEAVLRDIENGNIRSNN